MLAKIYGNKMWFAFNMMKRTIPGEKKNSSLYSISRAYISNAISESNKGRTNTPAQIEALIKLCTDTFVCEDKEGNRFRASRDDERFISGEIWSYRLGFKHKESTKEKMSRNGIKNKTCYSSPDGEVRYFF